MKECLLSCILACAKSLLLLDTYVCYSNMSVPALLEHKLDLIAIDRMALQACFCRGSVLFV